MANDPQKPAAPKAHQADDLDLRAAYETQAKELSDLRVLLMAAIRSQPAVTPDSIWAKEHQKEAAIKAELDRLAESFADSCQKRTQCEANKLNPEFKKLYKVSVGWCPEIVLRANDQTMAKAYYDKLCGIISVNTLHVKKGTEYKIIDVTSDPAAHELVMSHPQHKAAA